MSLASGIRGWSISMYGQSGLAMDWYNLTDPFTQLVPLKITNAFSGTLWFQCALQLPRSGYYNFSGIQIGSVNSGASAVLVTTWDVGVSGWIVSSSPVNDALTLGIVAYTSSNYTGAYSSGSFTFNNNLFTRWSGVIKVFGDIYNNDQPTPSVSQAGTTGTLSLSGYSYAISYVLSGWESDIGVPTSLSPNSGALAISWASITGVTQYFLWRWSGSVDYTVYSGMAGLSGSISQTLGTLRPMDLVYASNQLSLTDTGISPLQAGLFRHRNWQGWGTQMSVTSDTSTYLSPPSSRKIPIPAGATLWAHGYQLNKNVSGTSLLGPFFFEFHERQTGATPNMGIAIQNGIDGFISGTAIEDTTVMGSELVNVWYRHVIIAGTSGILSVSGDVHIQFEAPGGPIINCDDVFVVAVS